MKIQMSLIRSMKVLTEDLLAASGFDPKKNETGVPEVDNIKLPKLAKEAFQDKFGPMSPGFKVHWGPLEQMFTTVGIEAMRFTVEQEELTGGLIDADPMDQAAWTRLDGRLESELARVGIVVDPVHFDWKFTWEVAK